MRTVPKLLQLAISLCLLSSAFLIQPARSESAPPASTTLTAPQLEQLVAPIALYPDPLLSQILMASTYPLEVVAAARWAQSNPSVTGSALENAMAQQTWDPSVKALAAVPQVLGMLNDKLDWTQQLGDAFLAQQEDVLAAVQRLRARADANGNLKSSSEQTVTKTVRSSPPATSGGSAASIQPANVYAIEPTNPDQYYVPVYDPGEVYGAWPYADYAPFYWYPPGWGAGRLFAFGAGVLVGSAIWGNIDWLRNRVGINPLRYNRFNRTNITSTNWTHNNVHRGAVPYRNAAVAQRFGGQAQSAAREAFRGRADTGRRDLNRQGQRNHVQARNAGNGQQARNARNQNRARNAANHARNTRSGAGGHAANNNRARNTQAAHRAAARTHRPAAASHAGSFRAANARAMYRGGAGGFRGGGGGFRGGGGRRSDIRLKRDVVLLGQLENGLGFYRFRYYDGAKAYVGVMAQEVRAIMPEAVRLASDGYYRVFYDKLGLKFQSYDRWIASGGMLPDVSPTQR